MNFEIEPKNETVWRGRAGCLDAFLIIVSVPIITVGIILWNYL